MKPSPTILIPLPTPHDTLSASQAELGAVVQPLRRLQTMEEGEWEEFILEWVDSLRADQKYTDVHRCGGAGDMGRDIIGFSAGINPESPWDNYQCKHYTRVLSVADVVAEIGKLLYYVSQGKFNSPAAYNFVTPRGPSTALLKCLQRGLLKQELCDRWDTQCRPAITAKHPIELSAVQASIDAFDFSRVAVLSPLQVIEGHRKTAYYPFRFGGGLPSRPMPIPKPPDAFEPHETVYIKKLFDAYEDDRGAAFATVENLAAGAPDLAKHLDRSREQFFSAESLRNLSRDNVPAGTFEHLQDEVFDGVQEVYEDEQHASGYQRVRETVKQARNIAITGNPLIGVMHTNDRAGICHQLANDDRMTWVRKQQEEDDE